MQHLQLSIYTYTQKEIIAYLNIFRWAITNNVYNRKGYGDTIMEDFQYMRRKDKGWSFDKPIVQWSQTQCARLLLLSGINLAFNLRGVILVILVVSSSLKGVLLLKQRSNSNKVLPLLNTRHLSRVTVLVSSFHSPAIAAAWIHLVSAMP